MCRARGCYIHDTEPSGHTQAHRTSRARRRAHDTPSEREQKQWASVLAIETKQTISPVNGLKEKWGERGAWPKENVAVTAPRVSCEIREKSLPRPPATYLLVLQTHDQQGVWHLRAMLKTLVDD